jgi:hypothetical protein
MLSQPILSLCENRSGFLLRLHSTQDFFRVVEIVSLATSEIIKIILEQSNHYNFYHNPDEETFGHP